jgi:putative transcriptional regulator
MSKAGERILRSARQAVDYARGARAGYEVYAPDRIDVRAIRRRMGLSQAQFARRFGFALAAVQNWEQGRRQPEPSARLFLKVIAREPKAVERALSD